MINIQPTMTDDQVMDFIFRGYVILEGVIPDAFNRHCETFQGGRITEFVNTPEFRREVFLRPEVAGVPRTLLGPNFFAPISAHHHLYEAPHQGQTWHSDGISESDFGVHHLQCYYYPQDVKLEDGPTMVLPGSHQRLVDREAIAHYGDILGQLSMVVPAGTVVLTHYGIWHKAGPKLNDKRRGMIKFSYFRNAQPKRDWARDSDEIPAYRSRGRHPYATEIEFYRDMARERRMWAWMCGLKPLEDICHGAKIFIQARPLSEISDNV
jgi:hypothetical protein